MKKKLFTLLMLMLCVASGAWAGDVYKISFNGSNAEWKNGESVTAGTFFSWNSSKHNFNTKFNGCTYDGVTYTSGLKMESATSVSWTSAAEATVTIVQSTYGPKTIKFDGAELSLDNAESITGGYVHTITGVAANSHSVTRGSGETGLFAIIVEYTGASLTQLDTPTININSATGEVTIGTVANATKITYTTDGTTPTAASNEYTAPFIVEDGTIVKAIAIGDQTSYSNSDVATTTAVLDNVTVETPVINQYNGTVAITCATANTTIEYSLDGTTYSNYSRAFTLSSDGTVYARAKRGDTYSDVASAEVTTIGIGAATKTILMGFGSFTVDSSHKYIMTGKSGDDAEGYTLTIDNTSKSWSELTNTKLTMTQNGNAERTAIKLSNGAKNILTLPTGVKATRITIYSVINSAPGRTSYWKEFNGENINGADVPMGAWNDVEDRTTNPDVRVFPLTGEETEITFTNAGEQLGFVIALDVILPVKTIGTAGYATFCTDVPVSFEGSGVTAYIATLSGSNVSFSEVTSVPANTGVLLKGEAGEKTFSVATGSTDDVSDNIFVGVTEETVVEGAGIYVLMNGSAGVGFYKTSAPSFTVGANTAYLPADVAGAEARSFIGFDNETTGISDVAVAENVEGKMFNMQGVSVAQPTKGLYIVNGKKVIVK